jgi:hypothetical protein
VAVVPLVFAVANGASMAVLEHTQENVYQDIKPVTKNYKFVLGHLLVVHQFLVVDTEVAEHGFVIIIGGRIFVQKVVTQVARSALCLTVLDAVFV